MKVELTFLDVHPTNVQVDFADLLLDGVVLSPRQPA